MSELLNKELKNENLERIPKTLYRDLAVQIKSIKNNSTQGEENILARLNAREMRLIHSFGSRLLQMRIEKAAKMSRESLDEGRLTPEEKYILEALTESNRRMDLVKGAIQDGRGSILSRISDIIASRLVVVRFIQPMPSVMGVDLRRYGPFEANDRAVVPLENARPLLKQGLIKETWGED
jgi:DNA replication factor GINS